MIVEPIRRTLLAMVSVALTAVTATAGITPVGLRTEYRTNPLGIDCAAPRLQPEDWQAEWISFRDDSAVHDSRKQLHLPPARHYRKDFRLDGSVKRATIYASALGIDDINLNGRRVSDRYFAPGWSD